MSLWNATVVLRPSHLLTNSQQACSSSMPVPIKCNMSSAQKLSDVHRITSGSEHQEHLQLLLPKVPLQKAWSSQSMVARINMNSALSASYLRQRSLIEETLRFLLLTCDRGA